MTVEARVTKLEERVIRLEADRDSHSDKFGQLLHAVVDMHDDVRRLHARFDKLNMDLPDIIARAMAPLLTRRDD